MFKLLIVDDFIVDRENIKEIINKITDIDIEIVGDCENGEQALELIPVLQPDIIISDIEMPYLDGFQLAKEVKKEYPDIKIIFCTLYKYFEYIKQAFYSDGYGYILKPVVPEDLKECIVSVTNKIKMEATRFQQYERLKNLLEESKPILAENLIRELILGFERNDKDIWERISFLNLNIKKGSYMLAYIEIDNFSKVTASFGIEQKQIFSLRIYERIKSVDDSSFRKLYCRLDDEHFAVIFNFDDGPDEESMLMGAAFCEKVISEFKKSDVTITIALSRLCSCINELNSLFEQCTYIMRHKFLLGKGKLLGVQDIPSDTGNLEIDFNKIRKELKFLLNSGSEDEITDFLNNIFSCASHSQGEQYYKNLSMYVLFCIQLELTENKEDIFDIFKDEKSIWDEFLRSGDIMDLYNKTKNVISFVNKHFNTRNEKKGRAICEEVKKYIDLNYGKNISLEIIAKDLYYSPNYLNYIFKQNTGENIYEYLTIQRIEKAKELLMDPKLKLYEITEMVGYKHAAYFSNVFKKYAGMTPKEYRERYA